MSQQDIWDVLKTDPNKWFSTREIVETLKCERRAVTTACRRMLKYNEIELKVESQKCAPLLYCYRIKKD